MSRAVFVGHSHWSDLRTRLGVFFTTFGPRSHTIPSTPVHLSTPGVCCTRLIPFKHPRGETCNLFKRPLPGIICSMVDCSLTCLRNWHASAKCGPTSTGYSLERIQLRTTHNLQFGCLNPYQCPGSIVFACSTSLTVPLSASLASTLMAHPTKDHRKRLFKLLNVSSTTLGMLLILPLVIFTSIHTDLVSRTTNGTTKAVAWLLTTPHRGRRNLSLIYWSQFFVQELSCYQYQVSLSQRHPCGSPTSYIDTM